MLKTKETSHHRYSHVLIDTKITLLYLQKKGYVTVSEIRDSLKWEKERACHVLVSISGTDQCSDETRLKLILKV